MHDEWFSLHVEIRCITLLDEGLELSLRLIRDLPQELHFDLIHFIDVSLSLSRSWLDFPSPVELSMTLFFFTDKDVDCMSCICNTPDASLAKNPGRFVLETGSDVRGDMKWTVPEITEDYTHWSLDIYHNQLWAWQG